MSSMAAAMSTLAGAASEIADEQFVDVQNILEEHPDLTKGPGPLINWIIAIVNAIIIAMQTTIASVARRIDARFESSSTGAPTTSVTRTTTTKSLKARCSKCHARGHDHTQCRTIDPSAMRKRVERNTRIARERRYYRDQSTVPPPAPSHFAYAPPTLPQSAHMVHPGILADATELRRRAAQSARDKRRSKGQTNTQ